jgi:hypothetical protein
VTAAIIGGSTLAGCGSSSTKSSGSSAASSSSAVSSSGSTANSPTSSGSAGSPSDAGQQYLSLTAQTNTDLAAFLLLPDATPIAQAQAAATKVAGDETTLQQGLKQATWPSSTQGSISALENALAAEQPVYQQAAAAASIDALKTVLQQNQAAVAARAVASNQVRQALGLPLPSAASTATAPAAPSSSTSGPTA